MTFPINKPLDRFIKQAVLLLAVTAAVIPALAAGGVDITGGIRDENSRPVAGAMVSLIGSAGIVQSTVSDQRGNYIFVNTAAGSYSVQIERKDYQTTRYVNVGIKTYQSFSYNFTVQHGASQPEIEIDHKKGYGSISGTILNADGSPAVGVDVAAIPAADVARKRPANLFAANMTDAAARTDNQGRVRIDDLPPGRYVLSLGLVVYPNPGCPKDTSCVGPIPSMNRPAFAPEDGALTVSAGEEAELEFRLPSADASTTPGFRVAGRTQGAPPLFPRDARGPAMKENITGLVKLYASACPDSPYTSRAPSPSPRAIAPIAMDGTFEFHDVAPGKYAICVAIGAAPYVAGPSITVAKTDIVNVVLPLMRGREAAASQPSLAGSGPLTLDWPRIEQAAKAEPENKGNNDKTAQKE